MSYAVQPTAPKQRPGTVGAASMLLYLVGALQIASGALAVAQIGPVREAAAKMTEDEVATDAVVTGVIVGASVGIGLAVIFGIGAIVLGALVGRGKNAARIVTWVLCGLAALCYTCNLASVAAQNSLMNMSGADPQTAQIQEDLMGSIPSWVNAASTGVIVLTLLAAIAIIILLALPASNAFFRKEEQVWVPPAWPTTGEGGQNPMPPAGGPTPLP